MSTFNVSQLVLFLSLILLFTVCKTAVNKPQPLTNETPEITAKQLKDLPNDVVTGNNQLAFDLFNQYKSNTNIFFSPYSISTALAMLFEGAKGQTANQMQVTLHLPSDNETRQKGYSALQKALNTSDSMFKLSVANALWAQNKYPFTSSFLTTTQTVFNAHIDNVDYKNETEKARLTINDWVEKKTHDKIKNLIPQGVINANTRLVLTNAIYFKGNWQIEFNKEMTRDEDFKTSNNLLQKVSMMRYSKAIYSQYAENDSVQMLELPYKGDKLSMLIYLPKTNHEGLLKTFNWKALEALKKELNKTEIVINLPKFKFETQYRMAKDLAAMGMPVAFTDNADFSGMSDATNANEKLKISQVIHQAFVEVNEEGTEAAAATAVVIEITTSAERPKNIPIFRADHPFIFLIQDKKSGAILFMGRVDKI